MSRGNSHVHGHIQKRREISSHDDMRCKPSLHRNNNNNNNDNNASNHHKESCEITRFLAELRIDREIAKKYRFALKENGFDDVSSLDYACVEDLQGIGIKIGHIRKIKKVAASMQIMQPENDCHHQISPSTTSSLPSNNMNHVNRGGWDDDSHNRDGLEVTRRASTSSSSQLSSGVKSCNQLVQVNSQKTKKAILAQQPRFLTPEERLLAHKERKLLENKYKEKVGKWEKPPVEKSLVKTKKVKRNDQFVERLTSNPLERRKHDEIKRRVENSLKNNEHSPSHQNNEINIDFNNSKSINNSGIVRTPPMTSKTGKQIAKKLGYLNTENTNNDNESSGWSQNENIEHSRMKKRIKSPIHRCDTCNSSINCEEDLDNPGIFYCSRCWEEYDRSITSDSHSEEEHTVVSSGNSINLPMDLSVHFDSTITPRSVTTPISAPLKDKQRDRHDEALWIIHDNPQLGNKLLISGRTMKCWIETKDPDKKDCMRVIIGNIDYSGDLINGGIESNDRQFLDSYSTLVGNECIRLRNAVGFFVNYSTVDTRVSRDDKLVEFRLDTDGGFPLTGSCAKMSTKEFFQKCNGCLDVILDPQCAPGDWYPWRENASKRKIAPQFRSKGVGYIRLGDDMSRNGLAFLSGDGGRTFFSEIIQQTAAVTRVQSCGNIQQSNSSLKSVSTSKKDKKVKRAATMGNIKKECDVKKAVTRKSFHETHNNLEEVQDNIDDDESIVHDDPYDLLKRLDESEGSLPLKWDEKSELVDNFGKAVSRQCKDANLSGKALTALQDILSSKNVNIFVLRSTLQAVSRIGKSLSKDLLSHAAWRIIFVEMLKFLKRKQVASEAKKTLNSLHGICYTLSNSVILISQVLGLGQVGTSKGKSNMTPLKGNSGKMNVEIMEWLIKTIESESNMIGIDPILDKKGLNILSSFFLIQANHRDQKCRKHAFDGLIYLLVYAIKKVHMNVKEALSLCDELKTINPRGWKTILEKLNVEA